MGEKEKPNEKTKNTELNLATDVYRTREGEKADDILAERGYELKEKLGAGAFASVYRAIRLKDGFILACKVIEIKRKRRERLTDLKNELYVLEKVEHPNIVKLFEHFVIDEKVYIFMEFAPAGTLSEYVRKRGPIRERKSRRWFVEIASAIQHLHRLNIAHRDLKLGNILLDGQFQCKVTDFGLSRVSYKPSKGVLYCTSCCGTEPYMAPEILKKRSDGTRLYDPMVADIWALGVCLYAMVNKAYPFNPEDKELMISNQLHRKWKFVRKQRNKLSLEVKDIVRHMLEPNPRKRITMLGIMQHPWIKEAVCHSDDSDSTSKDKQTDGGTLTEVKTLAKPRGSKSSEDMESKLVAPVAMSKMKVKLKKPKELKDVPQEEQT